MSVLNKDFDTLTADGSTAAHNIPLSRNYVFYASGDFDGGVVFLESSIDGGTVYHNVGSLSRSGRQPIKLSSGEFIRTTLTGSNGGASVKTGVRE
jgi:hypothetical protein